MFTTRPELVGTYGMVASMHWLASAAGMAVLEDGGNAFDAVVAAGFVLQVVEPHLNGPGGEVPAVFATAGDPTPRVLCGQGVAPAAATPEHYAALGLDLVPGTGLLAATVPGAWDAWLMLLRDHGTKPLCDVLGYAISYARGGFPVAERFGATVAAVAELFVEHWPTSAALWLPGGRPPAVRYANPMLADTWERLLAEAQAATGREAQIDAARRAWSQGFVAQAVDSWCRKAVRDDSGRDHTGVLTGEDMARWAASYEPAVTVELGEWTVAKCRPRGVVRRQRGRAAGRPALARLYRRAPHAGRRVGESASLELRPGSPGGRSPTLPSFVAQGRGVGGAEPEIMSALGEPPVSRMGASCGDTVHVDVVDRWGNIVSATPSGGGLQSSPAIPGLGFCLGTRAQMFWLEPGLASSLVPGRRPRTTLSPSLALRGGVASLAFGTPGADQQDAWQLCFWLAHTVGGANLQAAIDAPAWHTTAFPGSFFPRSWRPGELVVESRLGESTMADLREWGHLVVDAGPWSLGRLSAVARDPVTGLVRAGANARGMQGYAVGR